MNTKTSLQPCCFFVLRNAILRTGYFTGFYCMLYAMSFVKATVSRFFFVAIPAFIRSIYQHALAALGIIIGEHEVGKIGTPAILGVY